MQPYSSEFAARELKPQPEDIRIGEQRYRAEIAPDEGWVREIGPAGETTHPIVHVLGGKNVYYFLTPYQRGRLQTLPLAYDVRRQEWFDTAGSGVRHFPDRRADAPLAWTDPAYTFNTSCHSCHVSQLSTNYDFATDAYHTTWVEPGINCETCHGPGDEHARVFAAAAATGAQPPQTYLRTIMQKYGYTGHQVDASCAPCHAKMVPLTATYSPGEEYFDHFDLATFEDPDFYPDGRDLGENYTYSLWRLSPCAKSGRLDCMFCHTSSGRFRFKDTPNQACAPCHAAQVNDPTAHTHHEPNSAGNQCVACHMPLTEFARMRRSDHSLRPPMPAASLAFQSPNACNLCHADKDAAWADSYVRQWRQRDYQAATLHVGGLVAAARRADWLRLPEMLAYLQDPNREEVFANSLVRLLRTCDDQRKWPVLTKLVSSDPSPLVRSSAAEGLDRYFTSASVAALLAATGEKYRLVRVRAASSLAGAPSGELPEAERASLARATAELEASLTARPDDYLSYYNLGNLYTQRRQFEQAVGMYDTATRLRPDSIPPLINASLAYNVLGRNDKAEQNLRRALQLDATNYAANLNLGMLLGEMGRLKQAEAAFRTAAKADPNAAQPAYNLGVLLARDRASEALDWCRKAYQLQPAEPKYAYTYAYYLHDNGQTNQAVTVLEKLVDQQTPCAPAYVMLGDIHLAQGRPAAARAVYERALNLPGLSQEDTLLLMQRLRELEQR